MVNVLDKVPREARVEEAGVGCRRSENKSMGSKSLQLQWINAGAQAALSVTSMMKCSTTPGCRRVLRYGVHSWPLVTREWEV